MEHAVGLIGVGIMGSAMARNMIAAGIAVIGFDVDATKLRALSAMGGIAAPDPRSVAEQADVIVTVLPSAAALQDTIAGENGLIAARNPRLVVAECGTFSLADKERSRVALADAGMAMLDCPISGTGAQALTRDLVVYASGDEAAYGRCLRAFDGFARSRHFLGAFGNGSRMKYVANLLVAIHNVAAAEAMVLAQRAGLDLAMVYDMIRIGAGTSRMFEVRAPMMVDGRYDHAVTSRIDLWQKDMRVIGDFAAELGCPVPLFSASAALYAKAMEQGLGAQDTGAVCTVLERAAGIDRTGQ